MYGVTFALVLVQAQVKYKSIKVMITYIPMSRYISISNKHAIDCTNLCFLKVLSVRITFYVASLPHAHNIKQYTELFLIQANQLYTIKFTFCTTYVV